MELKDVASVSGKGGLFKVVKPTRTGVILEALDGTQAKLIAGANHRVSLLKEISIYTTSKESSLPLEEVFKKIKTKYGNKLPVSNKSEAEELRDFIGTVVEDFDRERVYPSDIKKVVAWYEILSAHAPETLEDKAKEEKPSKKEEKKAEAAEPAKAEAPKKEKAAKADAPKAKKEEAATPEKKETKKPAAKKASGK